MVPGGTADSISVPAAMPRGLNPFAQPFVPAHSTQQFVPPLGSRPDSISALGADVPTVGVKSSLRHFPCTLGLWRRPSAVTPAELDEQWAGLSACLRMPLRGIALCKPKGVAAGSRGPPQGEDWAGLPPELVAQIYAHLPLRDRKLGARRRHKHTPLHPCPWRVEAARPCMSMPLRS